MKKQRNRKFRLSQCMIVKNEEKNIERALSWGKNIMWEQIVVDTGSTDRTAELAKKLGAKVYHFTWDDDFSAAKNYALKQASGDWIAFLDADEYMEAEDAKKLVQKLTGIWNSGKPYLVLYAAMMNRNDEGNFVRIACSASFFRNRPDIRYRGRIHEMLQKGGGKFAPSDLADASEELIVYHTGYTEQVFQETKKLERNERIIRRELEERPDDFYMMGYLAQTYVAMGRYDQAVEWYEKAVEAHEASGQEPMFWDDRLSWIFTGLLFYLCVQGGELEHILEVYEKAVRSVTGECDFDYVVGMHFLELKDWERGIYHLERALELLKENRNMFIGERLIRDLPRTREYLAIACFNGGKRERCVEHCVTFLKEDRFSMGILKTLLSALGAGGAEGREVLVLLDKLYDLASPKDRIFLLKAAKEVGYEALSEGIWALFSPQEQMMLKGRV